MKPLFFPIRVSVWKMRWHQVWYYGLDDSKKIYMDYISRGLKKLRVLIFADILWSYLRYGIWSNQYRQEDFYLLKYADRKRVAVKYRLENKQKNELIVIQKYKPLKWWYDYSKNRQFLIKYSSIKWESSRRKRMKRSAAYRKQYNMGSGSWVQYGSTIICEHECSGVLSIGEKVGIARNVDIDYTGNLTIGNGVDISEGVKILTHGHSFVGNMFDDVLVPNTNRAYTTPLVIEDNVLIGARSVIMPGVKRIGENSIISVGSLVSKPVPPNCIVAGNPAKVIYEMPEGYRVYYKYKKQ